MRALQGVGDADAGHWAEVGNVAVHVRRRLSVAEVAATGLVMLDVRGTPEAELRLQAVRRWLPANYVEG